MAVKGADVGKDALYGAAAGSVLGPEGTLVGGALGAGYGVLSGAFSGPSLPATNANNFTFGTNQGSIAQPGVRIAQGYDAQGGIYRQQAGNRYGQANDAFGYGNAAQMRGPGQISTDPLDRQRQLAALGATNANAAQFQRMGMAPQGPSVAAAQLQQGQDAAMQQSLAMARSGRTIGGGAAAMNAAQFQNAQTEQATNQQAVVARLQEQQQYHQQQLAALGAAQQGYGQAAQQAAGINQSDVGVQAQNAGLALQQQGVNNQTTATYGQIGQGLNSTALGQNQLGLSYDQMGYNTLAASLAASEQYQNSINGNGVAQANINQANQNSNQAMLSAGLGAAATYSASDRDVKQGIVPAGAVPPYDARMAAAQNQAATNGGQTPQSMAEYQQQQQLGRQDASANYVAPHAYTAPAAQISGLSPQMQQMQLGNEQQTPFDWQTHAAHQQAQYSSGQSVPPPTYNAGPNPQPMAHGNAGSWGMGNAGGGRVSDVSAKKDIKPADSEPWYKSWGATLRALGGGDRPEVAPSVPPAMVRDPHNPSQMISPYASIGAASNGAHGAPAPVPQVTYQPPPPPIFAPGTTPPDTWGGAQTPVQPGFTPQQPNLAALDPAYAQSQAAPPGFQISDAHSKAQIQSLSAQNASLIAALGGSGPTQGMLNQAAADQDAGGRIQYRPGTAPPSRGMLEQAAADQDGAPVPSPDRPAIDLRPAMPYSYEYKDPERHGQGRFFGPMAQDLEKTPAGASVVKRAPDGTKMVDTSRLSLVNTGAISDLQRQIAALGGGPALGRVPTPYPQLRQPGAS